MKAAIIDYGAGNLFNIKVALERVGAKAEVVTSIRNDFDAIVLPGVGSFAPALRKMGKAKREIVKQVRSGNPLLAICLGMQLLYRKSSEGPGYGLGFFEGEVEKLPASVRVPHIGWNQLNSMKPHPVTEGLRNGDYAYFVHSYYANHRNNSEVVSETEHGIAFPAIVARDNIVATQFHPEKSGTVGARLLRNFVEFCSK